MIERQTHEFDTGAVTDKGCVRERNEDNYITLEESGVWVVADGMGGHEAGDYASGRIVEKIESIGAPASSLDLHARFIDRIEKAHGDIQERSQELGGATVGATLVALLAYEDNVACIWSGDSRIYRLRDGELRQVTTDHTEAEELLAAGSITREQADNWPRKNVITRAIGVTESPQLEEVYATLKPGDSYLLCSDGLTEHVKDNEIGEALGNGSAQEAAQGLVDLTLSRGAKDNVTVVIVRFGNQSENTWVNAPKVERETTLTPTDIDWSIGN